MSKRVLIVDQEYEAVEHVAAKLREWGYEVEIAVNGNEASAAVVKAKFDLILLEPFLEDDSGLDFLSLLRSRALYTPVIAISAQAGLREELLAYSLGCDDFLPKPCHLVRLERHMEAMLRRIDMIVGVTPKRYSTVRVGELEIDSLARTVRVHGKSSELTERELGLLLQLASEPGRIFKRNELIDMVWGRNFKGFAGTLTTHINRLRMKIEPDLKSPRYIVGVYGMGYKLVLPDAGSFSGELQESSSSLSRN